MAARDPLLGFATDSLRFDELLGRGGMGAVYRGLQIRLDRPVAIKVIKPDLAADPGYRERFGREAQTMGRLIHPHVIACHDFGPISGPDGEELLVMVMEFVPGASLGRMATDERLPVRQVLEWYRQAAEALAAAHRMGVIHRDIKPDNIMVAKDGVAKLADFGLARATDSIQVTATGALVGSPAYMSPEASLGHEPVAASDVYSLACSIFQTLAGRPPYHATSTLQVLHQHISAPPPSFSATRPDLAMLTPLLTACLAKNAADRPAPGQVARDLASLQARVPTQALTQAPSKPVTLPAAPSVAPTQPTVIQPTLASPAVNRLLILGGIIVALLALLVVIGALRRGQAQAPPIQVTPAAAEPPAEPVVVETPPPVATPSPVAAAPAMVRLMPGSGILGAELMPGHPAAPVGCPAGAGTAPRMLMSQLGRLRLRLPEDRNHVLLVLHPGPGEADRRIRIDGHAVELRHGEWQVVTQACRTGLAEHVIEGDPAGGPFFCAAAMAGSAQPTWNDLDLRASMLVAPEAAPLRDLVAKHGLPADFSRTMFIAKPLAMRIFGETVKQTIAAAFIDGAAPDGLLVETPVLSTAVQEAVRNGTRWCFLLLDGADIPNSATRADNFCQTAEECLRHGTLLVPVLGGLPMPRNRVLWTSWMDQVRKRLPGLPILDVAAVREFHQANGLGPVDGEESAAGLAVALRDLRARLVTALRPQP